MMPVYRYVDSNLHHQRNQPPLPQHCFPGFDVVPVPPHLQQVDPSKPPVMYEPFPCNSNYGYYVPYHGCCNHGNYSPGHYSCRPPYPQFPAPLASHHYPNYPTFHEAAYPVYYAPPHYSKEQPLYEYNKDSHANYHCCRCPDHPYGQNPDRSLKIEEQEPNADGKEGDSVIPVQPRSYPYPIVWFPPESMKSKENGRCNDEPKASVWDKMPSKNSKPMENEPNSYPIVWTPSVCGKRDDQPEVNDWDNAPCFLQPSKSSESTAEQQPRVWNGWFPLDINSLKSLGQGEGEKKSDNQQKEDKMRQFPFPIFWMPYDGKKEEDENQDKRKMITAPNDSKQAPAGPSVHDDSRIDKPQLNEEISDNENVSRTTGKAAATTKNIPVKQMEVPKNDKTEEIENRERGTAAATTKNIPVKQMEVPRDDKTEEIENRERGTCVKRNEDSLTKELGGATAKRKSSSPPKTSKLPPVCLRVSPFPKKRNNGNGSSRSPSPPKAQPEDNLTKASTAPGLKEDFAINAQDSQVEPAGKERKIVQVKEENSMRNKAEECTCASHVQIPLDLQEVSEKPSTKRSEKDDHEIKTEEEKDAGSEEVLGAEKVTNLAEPDHGQCKPEIKMFDVEAAKTIQSAYRGFEVRKWEPLKKLKQIAKVREQVDEVRNRIQVLESSSDIDKDDRQRLLIGEMIMSLLLKLDTIQGLHSSVRDARKSLVRELMTLQQKLDTLTSKWTEVKTKELATAESADCSTVDASRSSTMEVESKETSAVCINSLEDTNEEGSKVKEPELEHTTHEKSNIKGEETTEPLSVDQALDGKIEEETTEVTCDKRHTATSVEDGDVPPYLAQHLTGPLLVLEQKSDADEFVQANDRTRGEKPGVVEVNDLILMNDNSEDDKLESLPKEMTDHVETVCELEEEIVGSSGEKDSDMPINPELPAEEENLRCTEKDQDIDLIEELPVGIIDEEPAISEFEECEMHKTERSKTLSSTEGCVAVGQADEQVIDTSSSISIEVEKESELNKNSELELVVEQTQEKEVNNDFKFESVLKPEEKHWTVGEENNDEVHEEENDREVIPADGFVSSESDAGSVATQEKEVLFEEKKEAQQPEKNEGTEEIKLEFMEAGKDQLNLIEENKKLKEIMEKLMEAVKDQVTVISNLTERVKELEKLSRNKKFGKSRYRKARYAPSYSKSVRGRGRVAEAAMSQP